MFDFINIFSIGITCILFMLLFLALVVFLIIYFLPPIIAYLRKHRHVIEITVLTVALGWSFLGWVAALLWALNSDVHSDVHSNINSDAHSDMSTKTPNAVNTNPPTDTDGTRLA